MKNIIHLFLVIAVWLTAAQSINAQTIQLEAGPSYDFRSCIGVSAGVTYDIEKIPLAFGIFHQEEIPFSNYIYPPMNTTDAFMRLYFEGYGLRLCLDTHAEYISFHKKTGNGCRQWGLYMMPRLEYHFNKNMAVALSAPKIGGWSEDLQTNPGPNDIMAVCPGLGFDIGPVRLTFIYKIGLKGNR